MGDVQAGNEEVGEGFFRPPLYKQRYTAAANILRDERWSKDIRKVVDLGCAEMKLIPYLKTLPHLQHLVEVDIDRESLDSFKHRAAPLTVEYLKRRPQPLTIDIYQGSVAENDSSLMGADAIVCVELIEHLDEDVLEKMPKTIFGCVQPLVVVISTPNADFNPLFGDCKGFRHWDHKFEWTRAEFENWAKLVTEKYPNYTYELTGVGSPPPGSESVGHCSQIGIFHKQFSIPFPQVVGEFYELVGHYVYPVDDDKRSDDEKLAHEVTYRINLLSGDQTYFSPDEDFTLLPVDLTLALVQIKFPSCTEEKLKSIATKRFEIIENDSGISCIKVELHGWSSEEEGNNDSAEGGEEKDAIPAPSKAVSEEEDWNVCEEEDWNVCVVPDKNPDVPAVIPEDGVLLAERERIAPKIDVSWAIQENEANELVESLRNADLLLPPPAGYFDEDEDEDDDFNEFYDVDDERSDDDFDVDFRRSHDYEYMCSSLGSTSKSNAEEKVEHITDSGVDLPSLRQCSDFPKSTSVEVLHFEGPSSRGPSSRRRQNRIEFGDSTTLCYTGPDRPGCCPRVPGSPGDADGDSCSLDEPDRAADSGYPNSSSLNHEADVDADLTPEQVDDISRSEEGEPSLSEDGHSDDENAVNQPRPAAVNRLRPAVFGNVENGDLANNNRDGEGNNAAPEDDIPGLPLEFAAVVHAEEDQQLLLAAAVGLEEEDGVLPEHADPFPRWLSDLLGLDRTVVPTDSGGGGDGNVSDTDEGLGEDSVLTLSGDGPA